MILVSVNVGSPREISWKGRAITTGIYKEPVAGPVKLRALGLEGDTQVDRSVHGGPDKAIYVYPAEHYDYWQRVLPSMALPWGMFGENFTTQGLLEEAVGIGDRFRIGSAEVVVTQPRMPCLKLAVKFGRTDIGKLLLGSGRTGFYLAVVQEGEVQAGDAIELVRQAGERFTVADLTRRYVDTEAL
jgi:MOSC domain-containing protein YiiM